MKFFVLLLAVSMATQAHASGSSVMSSDEAAFVEAFVEGAQNSPGPSLRASAEKYVANLDLSEVESLSKTEKIAGSTAAAAIIAGTGIGFCYLGDRNVKECAVPALSGAAAAFMGEMAYRRAEGTNRVILTSFAGLVGAGFTAGMCYQTGVSKGKCLSGAAIGAGAYAAGRLVYRELFGKKK